MRDASPVQRIVSPTLTVCAAAAAFAATGDLRTWLLVAAVVVALPAVAPVLGVLLISVTPDWGENEAARPIPRSVAIRVCVAVGLVLAAAGALWYTIAPGVASYQFGTVLILPALGMALGWLYRHLSNRWRWSLAVAIASVGPVSYLVFGGSQWWAAYTLTLLPLCFLIASRVSGTPGAADRSRASGWVEGPWGPP